LPILEFLPNVCDIKYITFYNSEKSWADHYKNDPLIFIKRKEKVTQREKRKWFNLNASVVAKNATTSALRLNVIKDKIKVKIKKI
jgi:hypothetical protein